MISAALTLTGFLAWLGAAFLCGFGAGVWLAVPVLVNEDEEDDDAGDA